MRSREIAKTHDVYGRKYCEFNDKYDLKPTFHNETLNSIQNHATLADFNSSAPDLKTKTLYSIVRFKKSDIKENMLNIIKTQNFASSIKSIGRYTDSDSETNATSARTPIPLINNQKKDDLKIEEDIGGETESPCILKPKFEYRAPLADSIYPNCFNASKRGFSCMKMVKVPSCKKFRKHKNTM